MPKLRHKTFLIVGAIVATGVAAGFVGWRVHVNRQEVEIALRWSRMAPIPKEATDLKVGTDGSMFTREFKVEFVLPSISIQRWLDASAGIRNSSSEVTGNEERFRIHPADGAQFAEVRVDRKSGKIRIHASWS
jgi:hypothetical protein